MREHHKQIIDFLKANGCENVRLVAGKTHPKIHFTVAGVARTYVTSGTPGSEWTAGRNAISDLRHMLGLTEPVKRIGERRAPRKHPAAEIAISISAPIAALNGDWRDGLLSHPATDLPRLLDLAWLRFWRGCMEAAGGRSLL